MLIRIFKSSISLSVITACVAFAQPALAQAVPVFTPASKWEVGSTELSKVRGLKSMKLPCVVSAEYDNGFVVRFSGGGNEMLAMAVDFRQDVFVKGRKYDAMVTIGDTYVKQVSATAFTANTLIFNLRPLKDFYAAAKNGQTMEISIDSNVMKFSLAQLAASYSQLESCYAGENVAPAKPMMTAANVAKGRDGMPSVAVPPVQATAMTEMPKTFDDIVRNADQDVQPSRIKQATPRAPLEIPPRVSRAETPAVRSATWNAKAGEDIRAVLGRWANTAGYDLDWQAAQDGKVVQDVSLDGSFEDAVSQLLAENSAVTGISGRVETAQGAKALGGSNVNTSAWNASAGSDMQSVLSQWGAREGISVVWKNPSNVRVKNAINMNGSFESAVSSLLDQYANDSNRPVGQLNTDPDTGARTLLMDMDYSG